MRAKVIKRDGTVVRFSQAKIETVLKKAFKACNTKYDKAILRDVVGDIMQYEWVNDDSSLEAVIKPTRTEDISVEEIQDVIENALMRNNYPTVAKHFILYREQHKNMRDWAKSKNEFISKYKNSGNTADATIDDNSNVSTKNIGIMNNEIHKPDNILINRYMVENKLKELFPEFDHNQYEKDLSSHIIYKHDESSFAGAVAPYCCSISMYPFLMNGLKKIGGLSAAPKNLDSYCGMYINMVFAIASQFAGAVATSEFLLYFDYFARREWGDDYYIRLNQVVRRREKTQEDITILGQIHQYWQQVIYSINQPVASRGLQAAFVNFSYFDKPFFEAMFGDFYFPDGTQPVWDSLNKLQKEFMMWFNEERLKTILTFPVESFALIYKDGEFADKENADFVAEEYARGHSFFTYISDSADSLSSCCRLKNKVQTKEFNFTNGQISVMTGSKSVITMNLNRIIQDWFKDTIAYVEKEPENRFMEYECSKALLEQYLRNILSRVYKYHTAYNELLWDMYNAKLLPVYRAGFINLDKQYLTIGINGLNEAAEFLGIKCSDNKDYSEFCQLVFGTIKQSNAENKGKFNGHQLTFNTECVPAESLAIKNYNWDKADRYVVPKNRNLYASYIYIPSDNSVNIFEKIRLHGKNYIGDYLDGGSAAHLNLSEHLSAEQYRHILKYAAEEGCNYLTFNIPNCSCECGFIAKQPFETCPKCGSKNTTLWDRVIGYLTAIPNWSEGRRKEQATRIYEKVE